MFKGKMFGFGWGKGKGRGKGRSKAADGADEASGEGEEVQSSRGHGHGGWFGKRRGRMEQERAEIRYAAAGWEMEWQPHLRHPACSPESMKARTA